MSKTAKIIFTEEQLKEMKRLHDEDGLLNREIADIFGVSKMTINRRLADLGVNSRHPKLALEREKMICDLYLKYHNKNIVRKLANVAPDTISMLCKKYNIYEYTNSDNHRLYQINSNYFDKIDTPNKAYCLGMLFADGYISTQEKHVLRLSLQENDKDIMQKMLNDMQSTHPLYFKDCHSKNPKHQNQYQFSINDKVFCQGLYNHGMYNNKSLSVEYPNGIPDKLNKDFIRGLLDGDGYISKNGHHVSITGTVMILNKIKEIVDDTLNINCSVSKPNRYNNSITRDFLVYGRKQAYTFLSWLYDNAELFLQRKYDIYISEYKNKVV